jgi:hypothetical protein
MPFSSPAARLSLELGFLIQCYSDVKLPFQTEAEASLLAHLSLDSSHVKSPDLIGRELCTSTKNGSGTLNEVRPDEHLMSPNAATKGNALWKPEQAARLDHVKNLTGLVECVSGSWFTLLWLVVIGGRSRKTSEEQAEMNKPY